MKKQVAGLVGIIMMAVLVPCVNAIEPGSLLKAGVPSFAPDKKVTVAARQDQAASLDVRIFTKTSNYRRAGEYVCYTISVRNVGAVPVFNVMVSEPELLIMAERPVTILQPGESAIYAATHVITIDDVRVGKLDHRVTASGFYQNGNPVLFTGNLITLSLSPEK